MTVLARSIGCLALLSAIVLPNGSTPAMAGLPDRYAVILVLDGARPDALTMAPMPHLRALMQQGTVYSRAFVDQMLANTPPSHATIGTGLFPKHHGVQGFLWEDPRTHTMIDPTQTTPVQNGVLEGIMRANHVPSIAGQLKKRRPHARVVSVSAHKCYAADAMATGAADYILCALIYHNRWVAQAVGRHRPPPGAINNPHWDVPIPPRTAGLGAAVQQWRIGAENAWTTHYALWAFRRVHYPRVLMVNLSETDVLGHFEPNRNVERTLMREFDDLLGQIEATYRAAGLLDRTDFVITADHGMSRIHRYVPYSVLSQSISLAGATPTYVEHDTAVAIGLREDSKGPQVARNLFKLSHGAADATYFKIHHGKQWTYREAAWRRTLSPSVRAAYRNLLDSTAAQSSADVIGILAPNTSTRSFVAYGYPWRAGHLGPQWDDQHIPLILAGPGVRRGRASSYPARLVDVAPTVEHLLGVPTGHVDGLVLQDALTRPASGGIARQRARAAQLVPIVKALEHRSAR